MEEDYASLEKTKYYWSTQDITLILLLEMLQNMSVMKTDIFKIWIYTNWISTAVTLFWFVQGFGRCDNSTPMDVRYKKFPVLVYWENYTDIMCIPASSFVIREENFLMWPALTVNLKSKNTIYDKTTIQFYDSKLFVRNSVLFSISLKY